jgi:Rieske Fe-S protein
LDPVADPPGTPAGTHDAALAAGAYVDPASARAAVSRGKFLTGVTLGLGGLIGAAITVPVIGFALGPSFQGEKWYWVDLGSVEQYAVGKFTTVIFESAPDTGYIDRRVAFVRKETSGNPPFTVISNTCMHLGCPVQANPSGFACPCHGGQYDTQGRRTAGPPVRPLNRYEAMVENNNLYIGRAFACELQNGNVVMTSEWKDPGQPVQGLLSFLYPPVPR